jgi:GAF domain-containing protein
MSEHNAAKSSPTDLDSPATAQRQSSRATDVLTPATHADLSAIVLDSQPLGAVLRRIADLAVKTIPGAEDVSVTLIERGKPKTVAFSGELAVTLDERQYEAGFGPCMDAALTGQTILLDTHDEQGSYPEFSRQARRQGIRHVLSVGMPTLHRTSGGLNIYGSGALGAFDPHVRDAGIAFAGYAAVTLFNAALYAGAGEEVAQLQEALASRAGIEQAKGIIMGQRHCTADEAFRILVDASSRSNRKLRDVAQDIITDAVSTKAPDGQTTTP